jgi:hypothetical protein
LQTDIEDKLFLPDFGYALWGEAAEFEHAIRSAGRQQVYLPELCQNCQLIF